MFVKSLKELKNNLDSITWKQFFIRLLLLSIAGNFITVITKYFAQIIGFESWVEKSTYYLLYLGFAIWGINWIEQKFEQNISASPNSTLITISKFCFSSKNNKEVFEPIVADWQEEYFEALFKKEIWKSRWINVRYAYAFLAAMWQKSPIGDLIEFVRKIAK